MKFFVTVLLGTLLLAAPALSQSLSFFDLDTSAFPTMKGKFYAFDAAGAQVRPSVPELGITENGVARTVLSVTCPPQMPPRALSSVLVVDVSGSMSQGPAGAPNIELARAAANAWVNALPLGSSECALTSFDNNNYLNQDFTIDRAKLLGAIGGLKPNGGTDYDMGLLLPFAGGLEVSKNGKYQKVIVFLTDGQPQKVPSVAAIIAEAQRQNCIVYAVTLGMTCPQSLKDISTGTGGTWFEGVTTLQDAEQVYRHILYQAQGNEPCEVTWQSVGCPTGFRTAELRWTDRTAKGTYTVPTRGAIELRFTPISLFIRSKPIGVPFDTTVTVTATGSGFTVSGITSSNPAYDINPKTFTLAAGESRTLTVRYTPPDSSYTWTKFDIATDLCPQAYYASGGHLGKGPNTPTLKLDHPNGGEVLVVGSDTVITWSGIPATDLVRLEYSTDNGAVWRPVVTTTTGGRYDWRVPNTPSNRCLARVKRLDRNGADETGLVHNLTGHGGHVLSATWSPNGRRVATSSKDNTIRIWDAATGALIHTLRGHISLIDYVEWSPDGTRVASGSQDSTARIWDAVNGTLIHTLRGHTHYVAHVQWSPNGARLASAGWDSTARVWNTTTGALEQTLRGHGHLVQHVDWNPDGVRLATSSFDRAAKIWNTSTGAVLHTLTGHTNAVITVEWSPDGARLATVSHDFTGKIWDGSDGSPIHTLIGHSNGVIGLDWSPDGSRLATASLDNTARIWNASSGSPIHTLLGHTNFVTCIEWSPDGLQVATTSWDNSVRLWDAVSGSWLRTFTGHTAAIHRVTWSPDGSRLATPSDDMTAKIWTTEVETPQEDLSDALFSIVLPTPASTDIDLGKVIVGSVRDSVVQVFVTNTGTHPFRVDSLTIAGAQATLFEVVSGAPPFDVPAGGARAVEFRFRPIAVGVRSAQLRVHTQASMLTQAIRGEGVAPAVEVVGNVIDFGQVGIGVPKDTLRAVTIRNAGTAPLNITSVKHAGPNDLDFTTLAGGGAFTLQPGDTAKLDFRFLPTSGGRTSGQVLFEHDGPGSPTPVQLFGEGIAAPAPAILVVGNSIDFGKVEVGKLKDTIRAVTITNVGTAPATITGTRHGGPNTVDFTTIVGGGAFMLQPGDTAKLDLRFAPSAVGPTGGTLLFDHNGPGSPATVQLLGEGIGEGVSGTAEATVRVANAEAAAGELVEIPITLPRSLNVAQSGATSFTVRLRFNATLLEPVGAMPKGTIEGEDRVIDLVVPTQGDADGVLKMLEFRAGLGNDSVTALTLENPAAVGGTVTMSVEVGEFRLLGICGAGGSRLVNPGGTVALKAVRPNPAIAGVAEVEMETTEIGRTVLELRDMRGFVVKTFVDGEIAPGRRVLGLDVEGISAGAYFLTLRTPTEQRTIRVEIVQ